MGNILNVPLGVCKVYVNGTDLGHTIGGVEAVYSPEFHETKVDEYTGVAERWLIGENIMAKVPIAESTLANLVRAIPHAENEGNYITIGSKTGKRSSDKAVVLRLHPIANADNDTSDDLTIFKAAASNEVTIPYKNDGERIIEVEFSGLVDESRADGSMLALIGDSLA